MSDVRLATFLGDPSDGVGYINLSGFNAGAGKDFGTALLLLRMNAPHDLKALVLDLRGNPGGLLEAAVEVSSYLLPAHSDVVSSKGRDGLQMVYRSVIDPIRPPDMRLAVLVNSGSASASEIVAGAIQDTDSGVIVGPSKTFGKGLVQKIVPLPYDSALKYTVAKYYTPSGRCIQAIKYNGGRLDSPSKSAGGAELSESEQVSDEDRKVFYTSRGRAVRDGGGIEPDLTVSDLRAGPAESVLLNKGVFFDFVSDYVRTHDVLTDLKSAAASDQLAVQESGRPFSSASTYMVLTPPKQGKISGSLFEDFKHYVMSRVTSGALSVDDAFSTQMNELKASLSKAGLQGAADNVEGVRGRIRESVLRDLDLHRTEITNDMELSLLSRELPDRLLLQTNVVRDSQVKAAADLLKDKPKYLALLGEDNSNVSPGLGNKDKEYRVALKSPALE